MAKKTLADCKVGETVMLERVEVTVKRQSPENHITEVSGLHPPLSLVTHNKLIVIDPPKKPGEVGFVFCYQANRAYRARIEYVFPNGDWAVTYRYEKTNEPCRSGIADEHARTQAVPAEWAH